MLRFLFPLLLLVPGLLPAQAGNPGDPRRVLVLYHAAWPDENGDGVGDSREVALYYAKVRGVPAANLVALPVQTTRRYWSGSSAWADFHDRLVTPLRQALAQAGPTAIDTILLCYGVPYYMNIPVSTRTRRAVDSLLQVPDQLGDRTTCPLGTWFSTNPYLEQSPSVAPDKGRFNHALYKYAGREMYLVNRIDGVDVEAAKDLVDGARYGELHIGSGPGLLAGKAYIDTRYGYYDDASQKAGYPFGYGSYANADRCMAFAKFFTPLTGLTTRWEASGQEIGQAGAVWRDQNPALTGPAALLYGGWYNYRQYLDVWEWLPGSIACDLNSNSIQNFHTGYDQAFLSAAFVRGLSAGCGVVGEPYLSGHARPEVLIWYVVQGYTFAEAASLAQPALFWMGVNLGDPLYAPFASGLVRRADRTAPPAPGSGVVAASGTAATLRVTVPRRPADPDLCTARLDWGPDPKLGGRIDHGKAYRGRHDLELTGLADLPGYYYRVELRDPVGLTSSSSLQAFCPRPFTDADLRVSATPATVKQSASLTLRFAASARPGLGAFRSFKVEAQVWGGGLDITDLVLMTASDLALAPGGETVLFAVKFPVMLPRARYTIKVSGATATGQFSHSASFTVQ